MPMDVPSEYLMQNNGNIEELVDALKELQAEFVEGERAVAKLHCFPFTVSNLDNNTKLA